MLEKIMRKLGAHEEIINLGDTLEYQLVLGNYYIVLDKLKFM